MSDRFRPVPQGRLGRLATLGQLAGGVASGIMGEGLRRLAQGERPHLSDLLLTPSNALRVTEQLSRMRGAAMKLGQMLSMDAGDLLPPELSLILSQLRESAHFMPASQLQQALSSAWGPDWRSHFSRFDTTPIAAASIGQVHRAVLLSGRELAVKVQYPGIAASINSDIDNVATLLRMSGLVPAGLDIAPLLAEAKRQLHEEADYLREAEQMRRFHALLADDPRFLVPQPVDALLRPTVLPMDFLTGTPIETLASAAETDRTSAMTALLDLTLRELFDFGLMQTDPNFANYRFQRETGRLVLLDFGAARPVSPETASRYRTLVTAGLSGEIPAVRDALLAMGFLSAAQMARHGRDIEAMIAMVLTQLHLSPQGLFDFSDRTLVARLQAKSAPLIADRTTWRLPPTDTIFIQRKVSGMALLARTLRVRLPIMEIARRFG